MNYIYLAAGLAAIGYGAYSFYIRATKPERLGKLEAMKKQLGDKAGLRLHVISYSLVPIGAGIAFVVYGLL